MDKIGEGAYSSVYKVVWKEDKKIYALKKVKMTNLSEKEKQNALNEVRILASIWNDYVVSYKEAFIDESSDSLCIVMEFADNGDLYQKIWKHQKLQVFIKEESIW